MPVTREEQPREAASSVSVSTDYRPVVPGRATFTPNVQAGAVTATVPPESGAISTTSAFEKGRG